MPKNTPSFADLGVPESMVEVLRTSGITEPFAIQAAVLADALDGRDVLGRAPTGSGKTLAFGLPTVTLMREGRRRRPTALILSPTRELADQIADELRPLARTMGHSVATVYGGVGYKKQHDALDRGASLVVACPGRLEDLLSMGALSLEDVDIVVVDEADRMADMGFLPAVRRIVGAAARDRQTLLFSATLEGPVAKLTADFQRDPVRHEVGSVEPDVSSARHLFWKVSRPERIAEAARFADHVGPTIVFTRTRHGADRLTRQLAKAGVEAAAIHGGRNQSQRTRALAAFSDGRVRALVATDVAARGIHVDGVEGVVHFDPPEDRATYLHRSGRTARAGATGVVLSLVDPSTAKDVRSLQRALDLPIGIDEVRIEDLGERYIAPERSKRSGSDAASGGGARSERGDRRRTRRNETGPNRGRSDRRTEEPRGRRDRARGTESGEPGRRDGGRDGSSATLNGRIVHYSAKRGFGFIEVKGREDVFVHASSVRGEGPVRLSRGDTVEFELGEGDRGPIALDVRTPSHA